MTEQKPSPLPTTVSETPAHQELTDTTHDAQAGRNIITHESERTLEEIEAFWTPERMAQAQPFPPPSAHGKGRPADEYRSHPGPASAAPEEPGVLTDYTTVRVYKEQLEKYPCQSVGKLFFTLQGKYYVGSAAVVDENGLITAAHNLYDRKLKMWTEDLTFCPAYVDGHMNVKYGSWLNRQLAVNKIWYSAVDQEKANAHDVGFIKLHLGGIGLTKKEIGKVVAQLPLQVDVKGLDEEVHWDAIGYPGRPIKGYDFNGNDMWVCNGTYKVKDGGVVEMWGNLTNGASGGPWLLKRDDRYAINGISSRLTEAESTMYSSYFGAWVAADYMEFFDI